MTRCRTSDTFAVRSRPAFPWSWSIPARRQATRGEGEEGREVGRVTFRVTPQDDRDGALPVTCSTRSGSMFRIGRTCVTCSATHSSASSAAANRLFEPRRAH